MNIKNKQYNIVQGNSSIFEYHNIAAINNSGETSDVSVEKPIQIVLLFHSVNITKLGKPIGIYFYGYSSDYHHYISQKPSPTGHTIGLPQRLRNKRKTTRWINAATNQEGQQTLDDDFDCFNGLSILLLTCKIFILTSSVRYP